MALQVYVYMADNLQSCVCHPFRWSSQPPKWFSLLIHAKKALAAKYLYSSPGTVLRNAVLPRRLVVIKALLHTEK